MNAPSRLMSPARDMQILDGHLRKFRASTVEQIAAAYFHDGVTPRDQASNWLSRLRSRGLLDRATRFVRLVPPVLRPTFTWAPGRDGPNANALSYLLEKRFSQAAKQTTIYFATKQAERRFGGRGGKLKRSHQLSHDLACTSVYLHLEQKAPQVAADWVNEDLYARDVRRGEKLGDALLVGPDGPYRLIEVLGRYTAAHIRALHEFAAAAHLPYELW